jgi:hypothetical protein
MMVVRLTMVYSMVVCLIVHMMTSFKFWMTKNHKSFQESQKVKVQCSLKYLQNVKKIVLHQGFDHFNLPKVPHNGYKGATKDTKPK